MLTDPKYRPVPKIHEGSATQQNCVRDYIIFARLHHTVKTVVSSGHYFVPIRTLSGHYFVPIRTLFAKKCLYWDKIVSRGHYCFYSAGLHRDYTYLQFKYSVDYWRIRICVDKIKINYKRLHRDYRASVRDYSHVADPSKIHESPCRP